MSVGPVLRGWLRLWGAMQRYHRFEVEGLEHLATGRPGLIVGYHGRPVAHDLCMLSVTMHRQLGYMPHAIVHAAFGRSRGLAYVADQLGFVTGDDASLRAALDRGEHVIVTPGGTREGCRSRHQRYQVSWGPRTGYLKLALRHDLPIIPVAASGVDDAYVGLNDGYVWGKRMRIPAKLPLWLGVGVGGLWPMALPFPVKIRQRIGPPIALTPPREGEDAERVLAGHHERVTNTVQAMLDDLTGSTQRSGG